MRALLISDCLQKGGGRPVYGESAYIKNKEGWFDENFFTYTHGAKLYAEVVKRVAASPSVSKRKTR